MVETRLRTQLERARQEKLAIQKQLTTLQSELDKAHVDANKYKADMDQLKTQIDKAAAVEKTFASLRQTRDALETERDQLKRDLVKAEKELKTVKDETHKRIAKLEVDNDAYHAQIQYQQLEIEEARAEVETKQARIVQLEAALQSSSSGSVAVSGTLPATTWVHACLAGANHERIADALAFSRLEMSSVNVALWSDGDEGGFRRSLATVLFERGGLNINPDSPSFEVEFINGLTQCLRQAEILLFVPKRHSQQLSQQRYEHNLSRLVQLVADARDATKASGKPVALLLEDYPLNRVVIRGGTKAVSVSFIPS